MHIVVIDVGTSSMRGCLFNEKGVSFVQKQVPYQPLHLSDTQVEQDPEDWKQSLISILLHISKEAKEKNIAIDAITVTSQRSSIIPVDEHGEPLSRAIMWQDKRNKEICDELSKHNPDVVERCGAKVNPVFSGSKMTWIRRNRPDLYQKTYKFVNVAEYLFYQMTGEFRTDYTYGSRSNLMNLRTCKWDKELLELFEVKEEKLCKLQKPGSVIGYVTAAFSNYSGIPTGTRVLSSGGDQQCGAIGQGTVKTGIASIVTGTGAFLIASCDTVPENMSQELICNCSSIPGQYVVEANVLTCCSAFDWYCDNFYGKETDYSVINQAINDTNDRPSTVIALPYFQGRSTPEWNTEARATFHGVTLATTRTELIKALLEGLFLEIKNNLDLFQNYVTMEQIYIGGGLTRSGAFNQMQSNIYGLPLIQLRDCESAMIGALIVALTGLGIYESEEKAFFAVRPDKLGRTYEPDMNLFNAYQLKRSEMNYLYQKIYG